MSAAGRDVAVVLALRADIVVEAARELDRADQPAAERVLDLDADSRVSTPETPGTVDSSTDVVAISLTLVSAVARTRSARRRRRKPLMS